MPAAKMTNIVPVEGFFIHGVPAVPLTLPKGQADRLVKTGAFKLGGSGKVSEEQKEFSEQVAADMEASDEATAEAQAAAAEEGASEANDEAEAAEDEESDEESEEESEEG